MPAEGAGFLLRRDRGNHFHRRALGIALVSLADGNLVPVPGGVLIRDDNDAVIGAVGVSGHLPGDDEACAIHGITACDLRADPGA